MSPDTAESLVTDQQLRRSLGFAVEFTASLTRDLGHKYDLPSLNEVGDKLAKVRRDLENLDKVPLSRKRQLFPGMPSPGSGGGFFSSLLPGGGAGAGGGGADGEQQTGGLLSQMSSGVISELAKPLKEALSGVKDKLVQNAGGATFFLGVGVGGGTAQGMNLTDGPGTKALMEKVAADNGQTASGLNPAIENLGMGLTATLLGAVDIKELGNKFNITELLGDTPLSDVALSMSEGLGGGAAKGLNLGNGAQLTAPRGSKVRDVVGALGFGLTDSVTSAMSKGGSVTPDITSFNVTPFLGGQSLTQVAFGLADGLGTGAAKGLKMGNATTATPPAGNQASDVVGAFGFALTDAVTRNLDTNKTFDLTSSFNISQLLGGQTLAQVARMFADGIGSGATKGLNLGNARVRNVEPPQGTSAADVAGAFGFGLTESLTRSFDGDGAGAGLPMNFDIDGTLQKTFPGLKIGSVVQGFARGFLQGASDSIIMMGGIQAMMNGTAVIPTTFPNETIAFNDTLGSAGTGFGQGLGGQGVIVAAELIAKQFPDALKIPGANNRSIPTRPLFDKADLAPARLARRDGPILAGPGFNLSAIINADTISNGTQTVLDLLQCEGVGGIILIGVGLIRSGAISFNVMDIIKGGNPISKFGLNENVTNTIRQVIPNGTIHFTSRGNFYDIDGTGIKGALDGNMNGAIDGIKINSLKLIPFIVLLIMHSKFCRNSSSPLALRCLSTRQETNQTLLLLYNSSVCHHHLHRHASAGTVPRIRPQHPGPHGVAVPDAPAQDLQVDRHHVRVRHRAISHHRLRLWHRGGRVATGPLPQRPRHPRPAVRHLWPAHHRPVLDRHAAGRDPRPRPVRPGPGHQHGHVPHGHDPRHHQPAVPDPCRHDHTVGLRPDLRRGPVRHPDRPL